MNTPCKDCLTRHPGCHGSCWKYRDYREEWDRLKERESGSVWVSTDLLAAGTKTLCSSRTELKEISNGSCNHN